MDACVFTFISSFLCEFLNEALTAAWRSVDVSSGRFVQRFVIDFVLVPILHLSTCFVHYFVLELRLVTSRVLRLLIQG